MSLMAELGEGPPMSDPKVGGMPPSSHGHGVMHHMGPRPLLSTPPGGQGNQNHPHHPPPLVSHSPWICSFLSSRSQAVRYNGTLSNWETVKAGVPQGTKIGPIAFLVMFNDFVTDHQEVTHYKYVDDMTLSQSFKNSENATCIGLQNELDCLQQWADTNNMKINPPKCQALSICFQRTPAVPPSFHIGNSAITNSCMKILGVHLQSNLKWDTQISSMCKAFNYKLYLLRQLKRCCNSIADLLSVYIMYVRPTIDYACPVWYSSLTKSQLGCLEKLQRKALRIILSYDYCETKSFAEIYSQLGLPAMDVRLEQLFVNFGKSETIT